jgi:hypothetical protein
MEIKTLTNDRVVHLLDSTTPNMQFGVTVGSYLSRLHLEALTLIIIAYS